MILTLDVGNSHIFGGVFYQNKLKFRFRKPTRKNISSDELGIFFKSILRENDIDPENIKNIAICSVVPDLIHSLKNFSLKYFQIDPFILVPGSKTGLLIKYKNPTEVGADRIANAIAAINIHPKKNIIIIDFGTANTFCVITKDKNYLGGIILPGLKISVDALSARTSKLPKIEILKPLELVGRSTIESMQSGIFYGNLVQVKELSRMIKEKHFVNEDAYIIGTGGFARLFENESVFDELIPDLVLIGLNFALKQNIENSKYNDLKNKPLNRRNYNETDDAKI